MVDWVVEGVVVETIVFSVVCSVVTAVVAISVVDIWFSVVTVGHIDWIMTKQNSSVRFINLISNGHSLEIIYVTL